MMNLMGRLQSSRRASPSHAGAGPSDQQRPSQRARPSELPPVTGLDVLRYRYHHGTNLGAIFVLEKWLFPSMFEAPGATPSGASRELPQGDSELDAVTFSLQARGRDATIARWRSHWANALTEEDLHWLATCARCTSIRLPVGYWVLGTQFCQGTPFENVAEVYDGAWAAVRDVVARARGFGIGVLLDLHALPGGANGDAHSGTSAGRAAFWGDRTFQERATDCLAFMAEEIRGMDGVIGLQIVNEAVWDAAGLYAWYEDALHRIGEVDETLPVYVSDGWDLGRALSWANGRRRANPVVVDTHRYYTFSDRDRSQAPAEIIRRLADDLHELDGREGSASDRGAAQVVVGEYSCVLDGRTWAQVRADERDGYVGQFGRAQSARWQQRAGGAFFWTWKMEWMPGGEWGLVEQVQKGNIAPPPHLQLSRDEVRQRAQQAREQQPTLAAAARGSHEAYWAQQCPGQPFEHERYGAGWELGFADALAFFLQRSDGGLGDRAMRLPGGGDRIGCLDIWAQKRLAEYISLQQQQEGGRTGADGTGGSPFVWEWEQGLRAGISGFDSAVES